KILFAAIIVFLLLTLYVVFTNYMGLPETVPIHFNAQGEPDAWGSKTSLLILPGVQVFVTALAFIIYKYPNYANIPSTMALAALPEKTKQKAYEIIRDMELITLTLVNMLFLYIVYQNIMIAREEIIEMNTMVIWVFLAILVPIIIYYAIRMRRIYKQKD
ncbi:hypothetical protein C9439_04425, partial [archaeon SCG-AAA382B04]